MAMAPDSSTGFKAPVNGADLTFGVKGSSGLRQYGGYVREEFLPQLRGRQAARTFREMQDNSPTVGAILFSIQQTMRRVSWRVEGAGDAPDAVEAAEFVDSLLGDLDQPWADFVYEMLSMLPYGFAAHEIVYKKRLGTQKVTSGKRSSRYSDGKIGWARLALRGQDTITKWFFGPEGDVTGMTQQPWFGGSIDIPIEKLLLFRPRSHKGNPEGYSILRTAYRPWWFSKRLEEQEAIALERMSGTPEYRIPNAVMEAASAGDQNAVAALNAFKKIVTSVKVDEQMGLITPSDCYVNADGSISLVPMYEFRYNVPQARAGANFDPAIQRHKMDIMTSVLADFLTLGHSSRGTQSLASTKVDLFFQATEGWLDSCAAVLNDIALPRLWALNGFDEATMPRIVPDMPRRVDLDQLSNFIFQLSQAGARLFPDDALENYLRDVADLPELSEQQLGEAAGSDDTEGVQKHIAGMLARRMKRKGLIAG